MNSLPGLVAVAVLVAAAGCAPRPTPVTLDAGPADRERLLGSWRGRYTIAAQRGGAISFVLLAAEGEARGDVLMIPEGTQRPYAPPGPDGRPAEAGGLAAAERLAIRFVTADRGAVRGALVPYWDPDRACVARATFTGSIRRDAMAGTFVSVCDRAAPTYTGQWSMRRLP